MNCIKSFSEQTPAEAEEAAAAWFKRRAAKVRPISHSMLQETSGSYRLTIIYYSGEPEED